MKVLTETEQFRHLKVSIFLGVGFFDGVHLGHQKVLGETIQRAREANGEAWVLTFDRHPLSVLAPSKCPKQLTALDDRLSLFETLGMDGALVLPFTRQLAVQEPEEFVQSLCGPPTESDQATAHIEEIRCGDNWRFGKRAKGSPHLLAQLGEQYGFKVEIIPYASYQGVEISSTRIRTAVMEGRLDDATAMLGRPFSLRGTVAHGRGEGDRVLHYPTANLLPKHSDVLPPNGVYAVQVHTSEGDFPGVSDLGIRPTFTKQKEKNRCVLETHLIDFHGDLYGKTIAVSFLEQIRPEKRFESFEALSKQIAQDVSASKAIWQRFAR